MIFVPYLPVHLKGLRLQDGQWADQILLTPAYADYLFKAGPAWTGIHGGEVMGCAGVQDQGNKGELWALISKGCCGPLMVAVTREVKRNLARMQFQRLQFYTRDVPEQKRWAGILGFTLETPQGMDGYCHDGARAFMYSRVK